MKKFLAIFLFAPLCALAQGVHHTNTVFTRGSGVSANIVPFASVRVCSPNTGCSTLIPIYLNAALTQRAQNPATADASGNYSYYSPIACVDEQYSSPGQGIVTRENVCASNGSAGGASFPLTPNIVVNTSTVTSRNATASDISGLLTGGASGCTTGMVYSPASNSCIAAGGATFPTAPNIVVNTSTTASRNATASDIGTLLSGASGCTAGMVYAPATNSCVATSGSSVVPAAQHQKTYYGTAGTVASVQGDTGATTDGAGNETFKTLSTTNTSPTIPTTINGSSHSSFGLNSIYSDSAVGNPIDSNTASTFNAAGGRNYGPNEPNVNVGWTTSALSYHTVNFNRRGITQWLSGMENKNGSGDTAGLYLYSFTVGGVTGAADEGWAGIHVNGGEVTTFYSGTATATLATGATSIPHSANNVMCDQCFVVDTSNVVASVVFTGPAVASGSDFLEPIAGTVTPSTAYGTVACAGGIPELAVQTVPVAITCNVTGIQGSSASGFAVGTASLAAANSEQVNITAVGTISGGTQSVTFVHQHPNASTGVRLWQGGTMQGTVQSHPFLATIANNMPQMETCFGAPDSAHLACGIMLGGNLKAAQTGIFITGTLSNLTVSGTTVTATTNAGGANVINGIAAIIVAGCSDSTINGTVTNVAATTTNNQVTFTYPGGGVGCTSATFSLPTSYQSATIYNYAEQISPDTGNNIALVEPNIMTIHSGDTLVQPHPPTWSGVSTWLVNNIFNPNGGSATSNILLDGQGAGVSGGYDFIRVRSFNPFSLYLGGGGVITAPNFMVMAGPNIGSTFTEPMPGNAFLSFLCPAAPFGCIDSNQTVLSAAGKTNSGLLQYQGLTGQWALSGSLTVPSFATTVGATLNGTTSIVNLTTTNTTSLKNTTFFGTVTVPFSGITANCLQANITGVMSGTGSSCNLVSSVFGRTGAVVAATNDYTVAQVTGAAPAASPTFTGTVTIPVNGLTQCLHVNTSGVVSGTGADCGSGGGTMVYPSGSGIPIVSGGTSWGTTVAAPAGTVVGTTDTQTLTNKTLDGVAPATMAFLDATSSIQTQLGTKAALASPSLTGTPLAPTAAVNTNTTQIATTAFVLANRNAIANTTVTIASGTVVAANTCATAATVTMTGVATTSTFDFTPNADITAVTGWTPTASLYISAWPTANTANYRACNDTSASITTGAAVTFNVGAK